jgi:hypothetical protein
VDSCEQGNKTSASIRCSKILEQLHNGRLLKKGSALWSYYLRHCRLTTVFSTLLVHIILWNCFQGSNQSENHCEDNCITYISVVLPEDRRHNLIHIVCYVYCAFIRWHHIYRTIISAICTVTIATQRHQFHS